MSAEGIPVLFALDGRRDLRTVLRAVAEDYGLDEVGLRSRLLPEFHTLAMRGILGRAAGRG